MAKLKIPPPGTLKRQQFRLSRSWISCVMSQSICSTIKPGQHDKFDKKLWLALFPPYELGFGYHSHRWNQGDKYFDLVLFWEQSNHFECWPFMSPLGLLHVSRAIQIICESHSHMETFSHTFHALYYLYPHASFWSACWLFMAFNPSQKRYLPYDF